jgi:hypothetical protein
MEAAACGALAAISHDSFLTPFDVVKQRMQLGYYKNVIHCVRTILRTEGIGALYASFPATLMMNIPFGGIMVAANESMKKVLNPSGEYNFWTTVFSGSVAGMVAAAATTPLDVVKTRLQTQNLEHCTKSCEDPHFNPTAPPAGPSTATGGVPSSSGAGTVPAPAVRPVKAVRTALDGPFARRYRRIRPSPAASIPGAGSAAAEWGSTFAFNNHSATSGGLWNSSFGCGRKCSTANPSTGPSSAPSSSARFSPGSFFSNAGSAAGVRMPNLRMRALVTTAQPKRVLCQGLGCYTKQRAASAGALQFRIHRDAVIRALSNSSGGPTSVVDTVAAAEGPGAKLSRIGMVDMVKLIYAQEGMRGFMRGMIPRMIVHAPSVAISWTAYETAKMVLEG